MAKKFWDLVTELASTVIEGGDLEGVHVDLSVQKTADGGIQVVLRYKFHRPGPTPSGTLPPPANYTTPQGSPTLAAWADVFAPTTFSSGPVVGAPSIGPVLTRGMPGDMVAVGGEFASSATFETVSMTTANNYLKTSAAIRRRIANRALVTLSDSVPTNSLILLYPIVTGNYGTPAVINRADAWWLTSHTTGSTNVIVGDTVSVIGRCLSKALNWSSGYDTTSPSTKCMIWLFTVGKAGQYVTCTSICPHEAQFTMPAIWSTTTSNTSNSFTTGSKTFTVGSGLGYTSGLVLSFWNSTGHMSATVTSYSGTTLVVNVTSVENGISGTVASWTIEPVYTVDCYLHNGHGGPYGWSPKVSFTLTNKPRLGINYDVRSAINVAAPNGTDDTTAINNAIASAGSACPVSIVLQAGTYKVSSRIVVAGGFGKPIQLKGQGAASTTIIPTAGFSGASGEILSANGLSELCDLTVDYNGIAGETTVRVPRIVNCTISIRNASTVDFGTTCFMSGCSITAPYMDALNCSAIYVDNCDFYGTNLADQLVHTGGGRNVYFTNNTGQHLNAAGTNAEKTHGRFYVAEMSLYGSQRNVFLAHNTSTALDNPQDEFGDGEQFLSDGALCSSSSLATAATSDTVTITDTALAGWVNTRDAMITGGKGEGQSRRIAAVNGNTLTVDPPWDMIPDTTSRINICGTWTRVIMYDNSLQGGNVLSDGSNQGDSQGWQTFTGGANIVVDANTFADMNIGYSEWSIGSVASLTEGICPLFFNLVSNNTFDHCNYGVRTIVNGPLDSETATMLGNLRVNNAFTNTIVTGWYILFGFNDAYVDMDGFQDCSFNGEKFGIYLNNTTQTTTAVLWDTTFVGNNAVGSLAKRNVTVNEQGTTAFTNFQG